MIGRLKNRAAHLLRASERYTQVDMLYLTRGGFWLTLGSAASSGFSLLIAIAFANLVPPQVFGTYKYVIAVIGVLSIATLGGINTAYTQAVARGYEGAFARALRTKILWGFLGALGALLLAGYYYVQGNSFLATAFVIAAVFVPFLESLGLYTALLGGRKMFRESTYCYFLSRLTSSAFLIGAILLSDNLFVILFSYLAPLVLTQALLEQYVTRRYPPNSDDDGKVIGYGTHLSIVGMIGTGTRYFDHLLLFTTISAPAVAVYTLAVAPAEQLASLYKSLVALIVPKLSKKSGSEIHLTFWQRLTLVTGASAVLALAYVLVVPLIFPLIFPAYPEAVFYAQLFGVFVFLSMPLNFLQGVTQSRLDVTPKRLLYWRLAPRLVFLAALFIFVPLYGILGAVISRSVLSASICINLLIQYHLLRHYERE